MADPHSTSIVAHVATLDGFVASVAGGDGIDLHQIEPLTTFVVTTCNSHYRITVSGNSAVFVQGGRFFADTTEAKLEGSSVGGSLLKVAWIGVGLRMEISAGGTRIVTSPVRAISRVDTMPSALTH